MDRVANQRIAPGRVLLILVVLLAIWLGAEFYPRKKPAPPMAPVAAESKFQIPGLPNNPDWDGLPQIFAVWADHAEWKNGRTCFALWHPVMKTYSYYFEATRDGGGFRFKEIGEPHDLGFIWDESLGADCPIRFYVSESFILPAKQIPVRLMDSVYSAGPEKASPPDQIKAPPVELKGTPPIIEPKH